MLHRNKILTETYNEILAQEIAIKKKYYPDPHISKKLKEYIAKKKEKEPHQPKPEPVITKETNNTGDIEALDILKKILEIESVDSVQVQTHYGNITLPVREIWAQDGILKISVAAQPEK